MISHSKCPTCKITVFEGDLMHSLQLTLRPDKTIDQWREIGVAYTRMFRDWDCILVTCSDGSHEEVVRDRVDQTNRG